MKVFSKIYNEIIKSPEIFFLFLTISILIMTSYQKDYGNKILFYIDLTIGLFMATVGFAISTKKIINKLNN